MSLRRLWLRKLRSAIRRARAVLVSQRFGFPPSTIYSGDFFDGPGCGQGLVHAAAVAKILYERYRPTSAFDFGCGRGALIAELGKLGVEAAGCDGSAAGVERCPPPAFVFQADLRRPVVLSRRFDLVTCIEVAEHLPRRSAPVLLRSIADAAGRHVVFSAAESPDGDDHIHLRPPEYWVKELEAHGFVHLEEETRALRDATRAAGAPEWFQNTVVLRRSDAGE